MASPLASPVWSPVKIISIEKKTRMPSKYVLNSEPLKELLRPIEDIPVAIIPIVGPSRQGKSFILNYMIRFLANPKKIDWIGPTNQPLEGIINKMNDCLK